MYYNNAKCYNDLSNVSIKATFRKYYVNWEVY